jgi:hypothetical protein
MSKLRLSMVMVVVLVVLAACATTQQAWNKLTPDQKARVIIGGMQDQLDNLWTSGKAVSVSKPEFQPIWKEKIVPAFDAANKGLKFSVDLAMAGKLKPEDVYGQIQPLLNSVITLLSQIGVVAK